MERRYKIISPRFLHDVPYEIMEVARKKLGLSTLVDIANYLESYPEMLKEVPELEKWTAAYKETSDNVQRAVNSNLVLKTLYEDFTFSQAYSKIANVLSVDLYKTLAFDPESLYNTKLLSYSEYIEVNAFFRYFACLLNSTSWLLTYTSQGMTFSKAGDRYMSNLQSLLEIYFRGCLPWETVVTSDSFTVKLVSETPSPGFYLRSKDGFERYGKDYIWVTPFCYLNAEFLPFDLRYLSNVAGDAKPGAPPVTLVKYEYTPTKIVEREPKESKEKIKDILTIFEQADKGFFFSRETISKYILGDTDTLTDISFMFAKYRANLSPLACEKAFTLYKTRRKGFYGRVFPFWGKMLCQILMFGSYADFMFVMCHNAVPLELLYKRERGGLLSRYGAMMRTLSTDVFPFNRLLSALEELPPSQKTRGKKAIMALVGKYFGVYSEFEVFRALDIVFNPFNMAAVLPREFSSIKSMENLKITEDELYAIALQVKYDAESDNLLEKIPSGILTKFFGVYIPTKRKYGDYIRGKPTVFFVPCTTRKCANPETLTYMIDTKPLKVREDDISFHIFYNEDNEERIEPLIGYGTQRFYVCSTVHELVENLKTALSTDIPALYLKWRIPSTEEVEDASGVSRPNPYNETLLVRTKDHDTIKDMLSLLGIDIADDLNMLRMLKDNPTLSIDLFQKAYDKLSSKEKEEVYRFFLLLATFVMYARRWRGPGRSYPYRIAETNIPCPVDIPLSVIGTEILILYEKAPDRVKNVLAHVRGFSRELYLGVPTISTNNVTAVRYIERVLGKEKLCLRIASNMLVGTVVLYFTRMDWTYPLLDFDRLYSVTAQDEADANMNMVYLETSELGSLKDFEVLFKYEIPIFITKPLGTPIRIEKIEDTTTPSSKRVPTASDIIGRTIANPSKKGENSKASRRAFTEVIPEISTLPNNTIIRQDGYVLTPEGDILSHTRRFEPGTIVTPGWVIAQDGKMARI